jgi:hypothetical protein
MLQGPTVRFRWGHPGTSAAADGAAKGAAIVVASSLLFSNRSHPRGHQLVTSDPGRHLPTSPLGFQMHHPRLAPRCLRHVSRTGAWHGRRGEATEGVLTSSINPFAIDINGGREVYTGESEKVSGSSCGSTQTHS